MVLENVAEVWQCQQLVCGDFKRFCQRNDGCIGRGEYCERSLTAQRISQTCCTNSRFQQGVIFAIDDYIHNRGVHLCGVDRDGSNHTICGVIPN